MSEIFSKDESEGYSLIAAHLSLSLSFKILEASSAFLRQREREGESEGERYRRGVGESYLRPTLCYVVCHFSFSPRAVQLEDFSQLSPSLYLLR